MNYGYLIKNKQLSRDKLVDFGFVEKDGVLSYRHNLPNGLYVVVQVGKSLEVDVFDEIFNEKYAPFTSGHGGAAIKSEVREIVEAILDKCSKSVDVKADVVAYMREKYGTVGIYPWEDDNVDCVFKTAVSQKWYALIMVVKAERLGLSGDVNVDIINLKARPETIRQIVDNKHFFPAYHMNKTHWLTVLLDKDVDFVVVQRLVDESYSLVEKKLKKP